MSDRCYRCLLPQGKYEPMSKIRQSIFHILELWSPDLMLLLCCEFSSLYKHIWLLILMILYIDKASVLGSLPSQTLPFYLRFFSSISFSLLLLPNFMFNFDFLSINPVFPISSFSLKVSQNEDLFYYVSNNHGRLWIDYDMAQIFLLFCYDYTLLCPYRLPNSHLPIWNF